MRRHEGCPEAGHGSAVEQLRRGGAPEPPIIHAQPAGWCREQSGSLGAKQLHVVAGLFSFIDRAIISLFHAVFKSFLI